MSVDEAIADLEARPNGFRCRDLVSLLQSLQFKVRDGSRGGHKIVSHPGLANWTGTNFNCGHSSNDMIKSPYIKKIKGVLIEKRDELQAIKDSESK